MNTTKVLRTSLVVFGLLAIVLLPACKDDKKKKKDIPSEHYSKNGVEFDYPGDWKVTSDDELDGGVRYMFVEAPGNAIAMVHLMPKIVASDLKTFANDLSSTGKSEGGDAGAEFVGAQFSAMSEVGDYQMIRESFSVELFNVTVPHIREYHRREVGEMVIFLTTQASEDDLPADEAGLKQVVMSFKFNGK